MVWFALAFAAGVLLARQGPDIPWLAGGLALAGAGVLLLAALRRRRVLRLPDGHPASPVHPCSGWMARIGVEPALLACGLLFAAVGVWRQAAEMRFRRAALAQLPRLCEAVVRLDEPPEEGLAADGPGLWRRATGRVEAIDGRAVKPIPVRLAGWGRMDVERGDRLRGRLMREPCRLPAHPGAFDFDRYLETRGLVASVRFVRAPDTEGDAYTWERVPGADPRRVLDRMRARAVRAVLAAVPGETGAFLAAATFGYRLALDPDLREDFQRVGIGHVLAISGLHVGLVVALAWWVLSWFVHDRRRLAAACILFCLVYLLLSGVRVPAVRASTMITIYLAGLVLMRRSDLANSLGAAALLLFVWTPPTLLDLSFQLSFVAVLYISRLGADISRVLIGAGTGGEAQRQAGSGRNPRTAGLRQRLREYGCSLVALSLAAWLGVTPLVAATFHLISPMGLLANIVVLPLMSLVLAGSMLLQVAAWLPPSLGEPLALLAGSPAAFLLRFAESVSDLPLGAIPVAPPPAWLMLVYYAAFGLLFLRGLGGSEARVRALRIAASLFALASGLAMAVSMGPGGPPRQSRLTLLPGERSDTVLVESASGAVAVLGRLSRGGSDIASLLCVYRRRAVDAILAMSGRAGPVNTRGLESFAAVGVVQSVPLRESGEPAGDSAGPRTWQALPGAEGIEYACSRDRDGNLVWWAVRCDGLAVALSESCWPEQITYRVQRSMPGAAAPLLCLRVRGRVSLADLADGLPARWVFSGQRYAGELPPGCYPRGQYGVVELTRDAHGALTVRAYDGQAWQTLEPR